MTNPTNHTKTGAANNSAPGKGPTTFKNGGNQRSNEDDLDLNAESLDLTEEETNQEAESFSEDDAGENTDGQSDEKSFTR